MHAAAKQMVKEHNGKFPRTYESIIQLKGIGEYTAAAISSIAYNQPYAVVDGNVYRVLSRLFNIKTPINSGKGKKEFSKMANEILHKEKAAVYNQAIMELGAMICTPKNPSCTICCVQQHCYAFKKNIQEQLPIKLKKNAIKKRYFFYFYVRSKNKTILKKRTEKDIWKGLYELPLIETSHSTSIEEAIAQFQQKIIGKKQGLTIKKISPLYTHLLSHQIIYTHFIEVELKDLKKMSISDFSIIPTSKLHHYAFPILIVNYFNAYHSS
jgi:A/G-specific adenine glycosylase